MPQDTNKTIILHDEFLTLPQSVREWIASSQVGDIIEDINENAGIYQIARRVVIPTIVFRLVVKDLDPSKIVSTLISELNIKQKVAEALSEEIAERIFSPIKQTLLELGVDTEKLMLRGIVVGGVLPTASGFAPGISSKMEKLPKELTGRYDASRPENGKLTGLGDSAVILEMEKKRLETPLDVGGKTFIFQQKTTTLPTLEKKIDTRVLPTLREEGDKIKLKEEVSITTEEAPFMLHRENEFETVAPARSFRSNAEAGYPRKVLPPHVSVQVEIGKSEPSVPAVVKPNLSASLSSLPRLDRAAQANEAFRRPFAPPSLSNRGELTPKADPKVEGNTLDLRASN